MITVQLVRDVEKQIVQYINTNNYVVDIDVKMLIVNVLESMMINPKLTSIINDDEKLSIKLLEILKKYVHKVKLNEQNDEEAFKANYNEMEASRNKLDQGARPMTTQRRIILDSSASEIIGGSSMRYAIDGGVQIAKFRVPLITMKSIDKINASHVFVQCRQLRRNTHRTHAKHIDCIGVFYLQSVINHNNGAYTYTFKSIDDNFLKDLNLTLFELDFKILLEDRSFELVNVFKPSNSSLKVEDRRFNIQGDYDNFNLQAGDDILIEVLNDKNAEIIKCQINELTDAGMCVELPNETNDCELIVNNIHCIVNRCTIFIDYFEY